MLFTYHKTYLSIHQALQHLRNPVSEHFHHLNNVPGAHLRSQPSPTRKAQTTTQLPSVATDLWKSLYLHTHTQNTDFKNISP